MKEYEIVIGLEVHAQLKTQSKIFCACSTTFGKQANSNTCPTCTALPGALPVLNAKAVEFGIKTSMALDCTINNKSVFARKNYFYPDLPKSYQISQFDLPIAEYGHLLITVNNEIRKIGITRIHMEEDAGKNIHSAQDGKSYVDLNRAGVPLIEIVSEPDLRTAEEAVAYLKALRNILLYLEVCDGNMEEGSFRCDANVSVRPMGQKELNTRTELKNINSFRYVKRAIEFEVERQIDLMEDGEGDKIVQETRLFDPNKGITKTMRSKEEAHDYRYFPDPDLIPLVLNDELLKKWKSELPELPQDRADRFIEKYNLSKQDALVLTAEKYLADFFEQTVVIYNNPKKISNLLMSDITKELNSKEIHLSESSLTPEYLAEILSLIDNGTISSKMVKQILPEVIHNNKTPTQIIKEQNLVQISDSCALETIIDEVIAENSSEVERYRAGEKKLTGFFVGQIMKKSKGQANPQMVNKFLQEKLG